jgi:hypothetical protein
MCARPSPLALGRRTTVCSHATKNLYMLLHIYKCVRSSFTSSSFSAVCSENGLLLHTYICLAILENIQGMIVELSERSEILQTLQVVAFEFSCFCVFFFNFLGGAFFFLLIGALPPLLA